MQKTLIPINTNQNSKLLQITTKQSALKKRYVKTWTADQDEKLVALYQLYPKKWNLISEKMKNRNENQCLHRYRRICRLGESKKIWSPHEDAVVMRMIGEVGHNWRLIAQELGTKSGKQIRQRFINKLDPSIRRQEWTEEQDMKIIELFTEMGSRWCEISKCLPGRPQNKIKNRFYSYIQKNYDFKVRDGCEVMVEEQSLSQMKENRRQTAGIRAINNEKKQYQQMQKKTGTGRVLQQRPQNGLSVWQKPEPLKGDATIKQQLMENDRPEQDKQNNQQYNSLKEINQQCYFKYSSGGQNSDLLYFEDN